MDPNMGLPKGGVGEGMRVVAGGGGGAGGGGVQIVNVRGGTQGAPGAAHKAGAGAGMAPRVVIGGQQVVGIRTAAPGGITLQNLPGLQGQGHLLLKTENGQYQLLRVGPAPAPAPGPALSASAAYRVPGAGASQADASAPMSVATVVSVQQPVSMATSYVHATTAPTVAAVQPTPVNLPAQKPIDNTKEKCRNFLANLLDLSSKEPKSVEINVRNLIQELINAQVEPEEFCNRLESLLNASPQPCLIGFLKKSLPLLRQSLVTKELVIEGIQPPPSHIAFNLSNTTPQSQPQLHQQPHQVMSIAPPKPAPNPKSISILQNIPVHMHKMSTVNKTAVSKINTTSGVGFVNKGQRQMITPIVTSSPIVPKAAQKEKEKKASVSYSQTFNDIDKMAADDDINDVAAMGGVNLAEESQRILGSTEMIGTQIRSCKDDYLLPMGALQARIRSTCHRMGLEEPSTEVAALLSHATQERLKNIIEKLVVITSHRIDTVKVLQADDRYEETQDVKGQLKFLEELDRLDIKRREDSEREIMLRLAKSRSKNEDPEQLKLKAKAKEMQRAEMEELRQREANLTALQAIGQRKKPRLDMPTSGGSGDSLTSNGATNNTPNIAGRGSSQVALRLRLKRVIMRDMLFMMEQEKDLVHSHILYRAYLK